MDESTASPSTERLETLAIQVAFARGDSISDLSTAWNQAPQAIEAILRSAVLKYLCLL